MLTIQPNFSQRSHSAQSFGHKGELVVSDKKPRIYYIEDNHRLSEKIPFADEYDVVDADFEEITDEYDGPKDIVPVKNDNKKAAVVLSRNAEKEDSINDLDEIKENITSTMDNLKEVQKELPPAAQKAMNGFFTLGAAAVSGISVKYGFTETNKILGKLFKKPSMQKFKTNFVKPFKTAWKAVKGFVAKHYDNFLGSKFYFKMVKSLEKFRNTKLGKKIVSIYDKIAKSKTVQETKTFINKVRDVKPEQVKNATGDVLGVATGVSTAVAANLDPEKVKETI